MHLHKFFDVFKRDSFLPEYLGSPSVLASKFLTIFDEHRVAFALKLSKLLLVELVKPEDGVMFVIFARGLQTDDCLKIHKSLGKRLVVPTKKRQYY